MDFTMDDIIIGKVGDLATYDSFGGMVACKVIAIAPQHTTSFGFIERPITIKITDRSNPAYHPGETLTVEGSRVYPRRAWQRSRRGPSYIIVHNFTWEG